MENKKSMFQATLSSIIAGIIVAMLVYFGLNFAGFKEYRASAKLVTTSVENLNDTNSAGEFAGVINSNAIKQRTLDNLKIGWPLSKLDSRINIKALDNSAVIDISVKDTNKLRAEDLADEYADLSATVINNIYNTGASVMEYSYGNAKAVDNTLFYAAIAGGIGFLLYLLGSFVSVKRYNSKLKDKQGNKQTKEKKKKEKRVKKQVEKNKKEIEKQEAEEIIEKEEPKEEIKEEVKEYIKEEAFTQPIEKVEEIEEENLGETRKIDRSAIDMAREAVDAAEEEEEEIILDPALKKEVSKSSSKLEILGKLPKYKKGDLDV